MGGKRDSDDREKPLTATETERKAALRRRREILDALMKVLRGS